jgi:hypothetical protein
LHLLFPEHQPYKDNDNNDNNYYNDNNIIILLQMLVLTLHSSQLDIAVQYSKYELYLISQESPIKAS